MMETYARLRGVNQTVLAFSSPEKQSDTPAFTVDDTRTAQLSVDGDIHALLFHINHQL